MALWLNCQICNRPTETHTRCTNRLCLDCHDRFCSPGGASSLGHGVNIERARKTLASESPYSIAEQREAQEDEIVFLAHCMVPESGADFRLHYKLRNARVKCRGCDQRFRAIDLDMSTRMCEECFDAAGLENEHNDGHHDDNPDPGCPWCTA